MLKNTKIVSFVTVFAASILLVGCTSNPTEDKTFTMEEVSQSNSRSNCKVVINDKVYDVTPYIASHPGGTDILQGCGKDATALFTGNDPQGRDHSTDAEKTLERYYVGDLAK